MRFGGIPSRSPPHTSASTADAAWICVDRLEGADVDAGGGGLGMASSLAARPAAAVLAVRLALRARIASRDGITG